METEYGISTERIEAAARVLRASGVNIEKIAETLSLAMEVIARAFDILSKTCNILAAAWKKLKVSGALDIEPRSQRRTMNRDRARLIERRYSVKIRFYERVGTKKTLFKPP